MNKLLLGVLAIAFTTSSMAYTSSSRSSVSSSKSTTSRSYSSTSTKTTSTPKLVYNVNKTPLQSAPVPPKKTLLTSSNPVKAVAPVKTVTTVNKTTTVKKKKIDYDYYEYADCSIVTHQFRTMYRCIDRD